jgi:hypothetical protein
MLVETLSLDEGRGAYGASSSAEEPHMSQESGFQFTDDAVPRAYDEILVPRLFEA